MVWNTRIDEQDASAFPFSNDVLRYLDQRDIDVGTPNVGSVDLSKVVGTAHPDYGGKTWGQLKPVEGTLKGNILNREIAFQNLKRAISNMVSLSNSPGYYLSEEEKREWSFYEIEGNFYISTGNNRTVIGRFFLHLNGLPTIIHGVKVTPARFISIEDSPRPIRKSIFARWGWLKRVSGSSDLAFSAQLESTVIPYCGSSVRKPSSTAFSVSLATSR